MATRRMISAEVICSDEFYELSHAAQALYFQLNVEADDDGFVARTKMITRCVGCTEDDLKDLEAHDFIIRFPNGITVITDWFRQNTLRGDRYHETAYQDLRRQLHLDEKSKKYVLVSELATTRQPNGNQTEPEGKPLVANPLPQKEREYSIERLDKKERKKEKASPPFSDSSSRTASGDKTKSDGESKNERFVNGEYKPQLWECEIPKMFWGKFQYEDDYYAYAEEHRDEIIKMLDEMENAEKNEGKQPA